MHAMFVRLPRALRVSDLSIRQSLNTCVIRFVYLSHFLLIVLSVYMLLTHPLPHGHFDSLIGYKNSVAYCDNSTEYS